MLYAEIERIEGILRDSAEARALNRENILEDARNRAQRYESMKQGAINLASGISNAFQSAWGNPTSQAQYGGNPNQNFGNNNNYNYGYQNNQQQFSNFGQNPMGSTFGAPQNPYGNQQQQFSGFNNNNNNPYGGGFGGGNNNPYGGGGHNPYGGGAGQNPWGGSNMGGGGQGWGGNNNMGGGGGNPWGR